MFIVFYHPLALAEESRLLQLITFIYKLHNNH